ncbi:MAG: hypothetical protein ACR2MN_13535 [Acidimicrobiales bacterium]
MGSFGELPDDHAPVLTPAEVAVYDQMMAESGPGGDHARGVDLYRQLDWDRVRAAITVPHDAGEWADGLRQVLRRVPDPCARNIWVGPGWYRIVVRLDQALAAIDADYEVRQVKEKFAALRFYYATAVDADRKREMDKLVARAEGESIRTCENTGAPGILMVRGGSWYKTLDPATAPAGYTPAPTGSIFGR